MRDACHPAALEHCRPSRPFVLLASFAIVLYLLCWLQPVLIPLALAVLLTFVLSPIVIPRWCAARLARVGEGCFKRAPRSTSD
jgi:predicted PurR-regulated permease PerM